MSVVRHFTTHQWFARSRSEVFAFFGDAHNLERITPPWLKFRIVSPGPIEMRRGSLIEYRLRLRGIPIRWQTEITAWEPPFRFVDEQRSGPYRLWVHEHRFDESSGGTRVWDRVRYIVPGGRFCEPVVHRWLVAPDLNRIFQYRHRATARLLAARTAPLSGVRRSR